MTVEKQLSSPERSRAEFLSSGDAAAVLRSRGTLVDGVVSQAYRNSLAAAFPRGMALLAVGGYGRRELFPYSDIDLLLLVDKDVQGDDAREALSAFLPQSVGFRPAAQPVCPYRGRVCGWTPAISN